MKIRTLENLTDAIATDFAWRKKELTDILFFVEDAKDKRVNATVRQAVLLLYAHWEGFIKNIANIYMEFISRKKLKFNELPANLLAVVFRNSISDCSKSNKIKIHIKAINEILNIDNRTAKVPRTSQINTESNLQSDVLEDILLTLGISVDDYLLKFNLIDETLLGNRNCIAHGESVGLTKKDYLNLHSEILSLIEKIKTDIENSASLGLYKLTSTG